MSLMSKKERTQTLLDTFKAAIFVFMGALLTMLAFAGTNYKTLLDDKVLLVFFVVGIVFVVASLVISVYFFVKELKNLEKMR